MREMILLCWHRDRHCCCGNSNVWLLPPFLVRRFSLLLCCSAWPSFRQALLPFRLKIDDNAFWFSRLRYACSSFYHSDMHYSRVFWEYLTQTFENLYRRVTEWNRLPTEAPAFPGSMPVALSGRCLAPVPGAARCHRLLKRTERGFVLWEHGRLA